VDESIIFLSSALLPFLLLLIYKMEGKGADSVAGTIMGIALLINSYGTYLFFRNGAEKVYHYTYASGGTLGEIFGFNVDVASVLMGFTSLLIAFLVVLYAADYIGPRNRAHPVETGKGKFYSLFGLLTGATMIFIYSTNLVQFIVALELMAIALLYMVNFYGNASSKALKGFLVLNLAVFLMVIATAVLGNGQELAKMGSVAQSTKDTTFVLLIFAALAMSSQLFFYSWLPDSTTGPVPTSAYVHSASIVPLGSYMLFRVIQYMNPGKNEFWLLGLLTVALIILMMVYYPIQRDGRKLLSYSTMAQVGTAYLTLTYALLGHQAGLQIALYQVVNHAFVKALAFMSVGAFAYSLGTTNFDELKGIRHSVPWGAIGWFLSFFGLAGVLPLGLFFSKIFVVMVTHHATGVASWLFPAIVLIDGAVFLIVTIVWFRDIFFGEPAPVSEVHTPKLTAAIMVALILIGTVTPWITINIVTNVGFMG